MYQQKLIKIFSIYLGLLLFHVGCNPSPTKNIVKNEQSINTKNKVEATIVLENKTVIVGAAQIDLYKSQLMGKKVALVVNQTSEVQNIHLVDTLRALKINITKIFAPEHGFRGNKGAGETIKTTTDPQTKIPIISLYGKSYKPTTAQLNDIDIVIFDIQDVGARFYTYISTLHYVMEACAENNKKLIVLDRPNPNGNYIDGPILEEKHKNFVGMHPIPIVYGLTIGELANMINGEKWLAAGVTCDLEIIPLQNYTHQTRYSLPIKPSPNLPNDLSIALYPSLCLFEGTNISVGRGTQSPFQMIGAPNKIYGDFTFTPKTITEMAKNPPYENQLCYGEDLRINSLERKFTLKYLIDFYNKTPQKDKFFNNYFNYLAGTAQLQNQIKAGLTEEAIKATWQEDLQKYARLRKKYLLYPD